MRYYYLTYQQENDGFWGSFPNLHGFTQGETLEELQVMAQDLLLCAVEDFFSLKRHFPDAKPPKEGLYLTITMPTVVEMKVLLHNTMLKQKVSKSELARRMNSSPAEMQRILNPRHSTKLDTLDIALSHVHKRFKVTLA